MSAGRWDPWTGLELNWPELREVADQLDEDVEEFLVKRRRKRLKIEEGDLPRARRKGKSRRQREREKGGN